MMEQKQVDIAVHDLYQRWLGISLLVVAATITAVAAGEGLMPRNEAYPLYASLLGGTALWIVAAYFIRRLYKSPPEVFQAASQRISQWIAKVFMWALGIGIVAGLIYALVKWWTQTLIIAVYVIPGLVGLAFLYTFWRLLWAIIHKLEK